MNGTIKKWVAARAFGFISGEDGREYFVHHTGLDESLDKDTIAEGDRVDFEADEPTPAKGPRAKIVRAATEILF